MHGPPRHYSYRVDHDLNFAPHIWRRVATVCGCKVGTVEEWAKVGSWVVGIGGANTGQADRLLYAMRVTQKLSYGEFRRKHPANAAYLEGRGIAEGSPVLISRGEFYYFGDQALKLQPELRGLIHTTQGAKRLSEEDIERLKAFLANTPPGRHGRPNNIDGEGICEPCPPTNKSIDTDVLSAGDCPPTVRR